MLNMEGSKLSVKPPSELTIYQVEELAKQLVASFGDASEVAVDLTMTDKIDTAGFQLLVSLKKSCDAAHKRFELVGMGGSAQNFTALFGYDWEGV